MLGGGDGDNERDDDSVQGADEGDIGRGVAGGRPAALRAASDHSPDMPCGRRHPIPFFSPAASPSAPRRRRDHREYFLLSLFFFSRSFLEFLTS